MYRRVASATACALAFSFAVLVSSPAAAINTYRAWDGATAILPYGCPDTTDYGQVITATKKKTTLNAFSFWLANVFSDSSMVVRGEVYAWDGTKATGDALWESKPRTIAYKGAVFHEERFKTHALTLNPGSQYVVFLSIDKDYEMCTGGQLQWGLVVQSTYSAGTAVFLNAGGDESQWTLSPWTAYDGDMAFTANIK